MSIDLSQPAFLGDRTLRRVLAFFLVIAAVLALVVIVSVRNLNRSIATSDWVNHTHALITELDALQPTLVAAEGELSRYLLTGDARDHEACQDKFAELGERVDVATALTAAAPEEAQQFAAIAELLARRAARASRISALKKAGDAAALQQFLSEDADNRDHRELARLVEKFRERQTDLLSARDRASFQQAQTTRWTVIGGLVLDLLLLVGAAWLIRDDLAARRRAAHLLQQDKEQLEARVRERTAELTAANARLTAQNLEERWAKQAVEHQNRYNLLIIDSISDAVFVVTKLMNISRMNPAAVHLTGFEPAELIDKPISRILWLAGDAGPAKPTYDPLARTLVEGHELRDKSAFVASKGGQSTPVRLSVYPLRDRDRVVGGVVVLQSAAPTASS
ncbi:MAG: CHASE3 domain-containing protein [Verrucomicrobiota bacterium]